MIVRRKAYRMNDHEHAGSAGFQPAQGRSPFTTRGVHAWASPTSRLEAGAPSAIELPAQILDNNTIEAYVGFARPRAGFSWLNLREVLFLESCSGAWAAPWVPAIEARSYAPQH